MFRRLSCTLLAVVAAACGGSPILNRVGEGRLVGQVGPSGRVLRGPGGSDLEGFELDVPAGALTRLIGLTIQTGPDIDLPGTVPLAKAVRIVADPDPVVLRRPATVRIAVGMPTGSRAADLVVASRPSANEPTSQPDPGARVGVLADFGAYDEGFGVFVFQVRALTDFQVRLARPPRRTADAERLVELGYGELARMSEASLRTADTLFSEALVVDPFLPSANLFRAISRVLVALDDRRDDGPGLDSIGEALVRIGLDVDTLPLSARLASGRWPRVRVPPGAPTAAEIQDLLRRTLRPVLVGALRDLDKVPYTTELLVTLPELIPGLPGERELDATDLLLLRGLLASAIWAIDFLEDLVLEADAESLTSRDGRALTLEEILASEPEFGHLRTLPDEATISALGEAMFAWAKAFAALEGEDDDQSDDLVVFARSFSAQRRDVWRGNLEELERAAREEVLARIVFGDRSRSLRADLLRPYRSGAIEPRRFVPELLDFLPLVGTLPDPTLGGLFPEMTQARAAEILGMVNVHDLPAASITADGLVGDWAPETEALRPPDPIGDLPESRIEALDLERLYLADSGDDIAIRIRLADGAFGYRSDQEVVYGVTARERTRRGFGGRIDVYVTIAADGPSVRVERDGSPRAVRTAVAARDRDLELTLDRFDLLDPDEPIRDRVVRAFSLGLDLARGVESGDRTRPVAVRF